MQAQPRNGLGGRDPSIRAWQRVTAPAVPESARIGYLKTNVWFGLQAGGSVGHVAGVVNGVTCGLLGWVVNLGDVVLIFGRQRRCLHDLIASTDVLEGPPPELAG